MPDGVEVDKSRPLPVNPLQEGEIDLVARFGHEELIQRLQRVAFRGVGTQDGSPVRPYADTQFSMATVYPPDSRELPPRIEIDGGEEHALWTPQPTIYANQTQVIDRVAGFLSSEGLSLLELEGGVRYKWEGRGKYDILPPIIEFQQLPLDKAGNIDLEELAAMFSGLFLPDGRQTYHDMSRRDLSDFFIDEVESVASFDIFNDTAKLLSYGPSHEGPWRYYIICDGVHRVDYALQIAGQPIRVLVAEPQPGRSLYPYYAVPRSFIPATRLSSKKAEINHPNLEHDKIHILNTIIKKVLHYDWTESDLNVSSLRAEQK